MFRDGAVKRASAVSFFPESKMIVMPSVNHSSLPAVKNAAAGREIMRRLL